MSADNWAICPRCKVRRQAEADAARVAAEAAYGTASIEEFDRLRGKAANLAAWVDADVPETRTFGETYEIWGAAGGTVTVDYGGECSKCGLSLAFRHEHPLPVQEGA